MVQTVSFSNLNFRLRKAFFVLIMSTTILLFGTVYLYDFRQHSASKPKITNAALAKLEILGINQEISQDTSSEENDEYVFVLPRKIDSNKNTRMDIYENVDHLVQLLSSFHQYDGTTCHGKGVKHEKFKSCWFEKKNWTVIVNGSRMDHQPSLLRNLKVSVCNIVEGPFLIRRGVLKRIGLRPSYGEATLLDFFLRTKGKLKIAASHNCTFNKNQLKMDRGAMANSKTYMDYGRLGYDHNILRIVREDSITWTTCSLRTSSCPDIPEQQSRAQNILLPYCCKTKLSEILANTVDAFNKMGIEYRVCFGTLLGAVRTKTIIPWTEDIDICIRTSAYTTENFHKLQKIIGVKHFSCPDILGNRRVLVVGPLVKKISNVTVLAEVNLFSKEILQMMQEMLPMLVPEWRRYGYADIYGYNKIFNTKNASKVTIDGAEYLTGDNAHAWLVEWYGKNYTSTEEKDRVVSGTITW